MITQTTRRLGLALVATIALALAPAAAAHAEVGIGSISGRLTDAGTPVPDTWVSVDPVVWVEDGENYQGLAYTDANGSFQFSNVLAGQYKISFSAPNHPFQYAYSTASWENAAIITVTDGNETVVNDSLLPTGTISGRIVDADGNGVQTSVSAFDETNRGSWTMTDSDGNYTMRVLPGAYRVSFQVGSGNQLAYGTTDRDAAQVFTVTAGTTVTVNDTRLATGSVEGVFTDSAGVGLANVVAAVEGDSGYAGVLTDANGHYRIDDVLPGTYRVNFSKWEVGINQYAYGKVSPEGAATFQITGNSVTTVNDRALGNGSLRVTAKDAVTGASIQAFWASTSAREGSTTDGAVVLENVPEGTYGVEVNAPGYLGNADRPQVTVVAGQQAEITVTLTPESQITTTVVDAATGQPLAGICVFAAQATAFRLPDGCGDLSDSAGEVTVHNLKAGTYQLFALPGEAPGYGGQWVGAHGGSGSQLLAKSIQVGVGQSVAGPTTRMDKAGTITGKVTGADGEAVQHGVVRLGNESFGSGGNTGVVPIAEDGSYSIDFLGPYHWPLLFTTQNFAPQWSGNMGNRFLAETVNVKAGKSVTYDITLKKGTKVVISAAAQDFVVAYNAITDDESGVCQSVNGAGCEMLVIGPQFVKFRILGNPNWWYGGADFAHATPIWIPATGTKSVTLTQ